MAPPAPLPAGATLRLNGAPLPCPAPLCLQDLLEQHGFEANAVASAVNGCFVPRAARASTLLHPGDEVLTFQAIVGG
ncbi:MAG: sulfur carrier protein ThiS [Hydrogenophaga sp.]|nr:sulfur carrier protein ThiS [Hydrogenophaga sp.]